MLDIIVCGISEVDNFIDEVEAVISIMDSGQRLLEPVSISGREWDNSHSLLRLDFDDTWAEIYQSGENIVNTTIIKKSIFFCHEYL